MKPETGRTDPDKVLRVLILASSYPRGPHDTASVFLRHLAQRLERQGVEVHVLAPGDGTSDTTDEEGVTVHRFRYFPARWQQLAYGSGIVSNLKKNPYLWLQVPFFCLAMAGKVALLVARHRPNVIHAHWVIPQGVIASFLRPLLRIPLVITAHGTDAFALKGAFLNAVKRFAVANASVWTANSRATAAEIEDHSRRAPVIIPMGVDTKRFSDGKRGPLRDRGWTHTLLFVGRLIRNKGVSDLLLALTKLPPGLREMTGLWIVGDGTERAALERAAHALQLSDKVTFLGQISNDALPDYYAAADLFVGPSTVDDTGSAEGQGVVFLEAFAARLPVVATRVGGIPEVVEDGRTGWLVEPNDPDSLAKAIELLLRDSALRQRLADAAFVRVQAYDWSAIGEQFERVYRSVAG